MTEKEMEMIAQRVLGKIDKRVEKALKKNKKNPKNRHECEFLYNMLFPDAEAMGTRYEFENDCHKCQSNPYVCPGIFSCTKQNICLYNHSCSMSVNCEASVQCIKAYHPSEPC